MKEIFLEEILQKEVEDTYNNEGATRFFTSFEKRIIFRSVIELCKRTLELAAENAKLKTIKMSDGVSGIILPTWDDVVDKQSILDTINQIK